MKGGRLTTIDALFPLMQTSASQAGLQPNNQREEQQEEQPEHPPHHRHRRWFTVLQTLTLVAVLLLAVYNHALIDANPEETLATPWLVESEPFEPLAPVTKAVLESTPVSTLTATACWTSASAWTPLCFATGCVASLDLKASRAKAALMRRRNAWRRQHSLWATPPALRAAS